ncbi:ReoY family proteolytic degradation factor [Isobaculum melis]|uniref:UPF0302 protein SAMN04488559_103125 n=1 Tax=Isobaculum melis TaxID=142588 RepID=A0A1H9R8J8_9LACT|nr:ReoY family proteolytic degradation factor [Isobaculum melis]SER68998.1 Uncharacterized protein YpiB, UPF0302 family [Isobaculum melis]
MGIKVSLEDKKMFLSWFLENYQLKRREAMWILTYLLNHDTMMKKVHFVEHAEKTPRGMMLSTVETEIDPFLFYKEGLVLSNPEQAFHEVRSNWKDELYLELVFDNQLMTPEYIAVLEDNPFYRWNDQVDEQLSIEVDQLLEKVSLVNRKKQILQEIDVALEKNNKQLFRSLVKELNELERRKDHQITK